MHVKENHLSHYATYTQGLDSLSQSLDLNPYKEIPETISKKRAVTQGIFRKLFPGKFHEYLPMKKYFFPKTGHDSEAFPETFSNVWK